MLQEKDFKKIPIDKVSNAPNANGHFQHYYNFYWAVTKDNCILFYGQAPICNQIRHVIHKYSFAIEIKQIEHVFVPIHINDWEYLV